MKKFYNSPCKGGIDLNEHEACCGCGRNVYVDGLWYFADEIVCPAATGNGCTGNPGVGGACTDCSLNPH